SIVKIALILIGADVFYFVVALIFDAFLLAMTFVFIFLLREGRLSLYSWRAKKSICFELLRESWPLIVSGLIVIIYMKIDQVMLMHLVGKTELGIYSAAAKVSEVWYFIPMVLANTLFPAILNAKKNTVKEYHKKLQFLYDIMVIIALFISIPMYFLSDIIVTSLYGADYASAGEVIRVYIFSLIFVFLGTASSKWFICEGLQKYSLYRTLVGLFINIGLNYILIPIYHGMGAAIATVISQIFASYLVNLFHPKLRITFFLHTNSILILLRIFGLKFKV
ncbi:flippase, partial [Vibrio parahaemolyticus]|nr:flippase [Vibrio parahaemolyticus]